MAKDILHGLYPSTNICLFFFVLFFPFCSNFISKDLYETFCFWAQISINGYN